MDIFSFALGIFSSALEVTLLMRAWRRGFLRQFPIFYSYIFFVLVTSSVNYFISLIMPGHYASVFLFCFTVWLVAEFAVLAEASDHIFKPYPPIRRLGRLLTVCICVTFFVVYVAPPLLQPRSSRAAIFDLVKRSSLTKAVLIVVLLGAARLYRLPFGRNVSGMMLGFATYLSLSITNVALAERYEPAVYGKIFAIVGPVSFVLALAIWNVALWQYEPVSPGGREILDPVTNFPEPVGSRLERYNSELTRLFRR